jgi:hypothetical protein
MVGAEMEVVTMADVTELPTKGRVIRTAEGRVMFAPAGTSYELELMVNGAYDGPINAPVRGVIRAKARKVYTVPSGGNFVTPIAGPPRIVQGWVLAGNERMLIVHGGANFVIELPADDAAIDLDEGALAVNKMVNCVLLPGASFECVREPAKV